VPWGLDLALSIELFAGQAVLSAMCRGLPPGTGSAEWNRVCAESISLSAKPVNPVVEDGPKERCRERFGKVGLWTTPNKGSCKNYKMNLNLKSINYV
jgi:hypothetical protein